MVLCARTLSIGTVDRWISLDSSWDAFFGVKICEMIVIVFFWLFELQSWFSVLAGYW